MTNYLTELGKNFRTSSRIDYDDFINIYCQKRKDPKANGKLPMLAKDTFDVKNKIRTIAMEQILADVLYDATGNVGVYKLSFEELCDNIELFNLVKKFPSQTRHFVTRTTNENVDITANKKLNLNNIQRKYIDCLNEIIDWVNTDVKNAEKADFEELVFILNPDENMPEKDEAIKERLKNYGITVE